MQESLFIENDYLGFKRRKLSFFCTDPIWKTRCRKFMLASVGRWSLQGRLWQPLRCENLHFHPVFDRYSVWKLLGIWNELFSLCIVFKNLIITIEFNLHILDLHDSSLQNTYNTYGVAWFRIKVNHNDSNENNTKSSSTHWQLL